MPCIGDRDGKELSTSAFTVLPSIESSQEIHVLLHLHRKPHCPEHLPPWWHRYRAHRINAQRPPCGMGNLQPSRQRQGRRLNPFCPNKEDSADGIDARKAEGDFAATADYGVCGSASATNRSCCASMPVSLWPSTWCLLPRMNGALAIRCQTASGTPPRRAIEGP